MKLLITGGYGFLGTNLAFEALQRGIEVTILDNLSRTGCELNRVWLEKKGSHSFVNADIRDSVSVNDVVNRLRPEAIFHLAGQVAMTTSLSNPRADFEINTLGTINILEAVRTYAPKCALVYSSTNKVYGELANFTYEESRSRWSCKDMPDGFDELTSLSFNSPYGCSKGAADQYALDYHRMFGTRAVVFRHSSMYGSRQFATTDQGWIGWFCSEAYRIAGGNSRPINISGDGKQVRDVLHADDMVKLYFYALERINEVAGEVFNIGGGMSNSLSLLELFAMLEDILKVSLPVVSGPPRTSDQLVFVADISKAKRMLCWSPSVSAKEGVIKMIEWIRECEARR